MELATVRPTNAVLPQELEQVLIQGDLAKLTTENRIAYYKAVCSSVGLNPLTKPFDYISLNGKLTLYAKKDCTDQLRTIHGISIVLPAREVIDGIYVVTAHASNAAGRTDASTGAVPVENLKGEAKANAMMKAETKAKRRATLSICGLGMLDETEIESIPDAKHIDIGNNPPNTQAAQDYVLEKKLAASRAALVEPAHPDVDPAVQQMYARMATKEGWLQVFSDLRDELITLLGDQQAGNMQYQHILGMNGADNAMAFKRRSSANKCVLALWQKCREIEQAQAGTIEIEEEDIPA